jgi:hypothetical protein
VAIELIVKLEQSSTFDDFSAEPRANLAVEKTLEWKKHWKINATLSRPHFSSPMTTEMLESSVERRIRVLSNLKISAFLTSWGKSYELSKSARTRIAFWVRM